MLPLSLIISHHIYIHIYIYKVSVKGEHRDIRVILLMFETNDIIIKLTLKRNQSTDKLNLATKNFQVLLSIQYHGQKSEY